MSVKRGETVLCVNPFSRRCELNSYASITVFVDNLSVVMAIFRNKTFVVRAVFCDTVFLQ